MEIQGSKKQRKVPLAVFTGGIALIVLAMIAQAWWAAIEDRNQTLSEAQRHSYFTVRILEEQANHELAEAVQVIAELENALRDTADITLVQKPNFGDILAEQRQNSAYLCGMSVFNPDGTVLFSSHARYQDKRSLPEHIRKLLAQPGQKQIVTGPVLWEGGNRGILPVAKNIYDARGKLVALIEANISLSYFQEFYEVVARGSAAVLSLHDQSGNLLTSAPFDQNLIRNVVPPSPLLSVLTAAAGEGALYAPGFSGDAGEFQYTYRKITGFPLTLVYARSTATILSDWSTRLNHKLMFSAVIALLILLLTIFLLRQIRRLQISRQQVEASENRYRLIFTGAQDPIFLVDRQWCYVDCNRAALTLLNVQNLSDVIGHSVTKFTTPQLQFSDLHISSEQQMTTLMNKVMEGGVQRAEWVTERNGQPYYSEVSLSRVELNGEMLLFCVARDINSQKYSERLLEGQNRLLQLIGANEEPSYILNAICDFVEELRPWWRVGIQLLDDDQKIFVQSVGRHFPEILTQQMTGAPVSHGSGLWSEAILLACPVQAESLQQAACMQFVNGLEELTEYSSGSAWPLMDKHGQVLGSFTVLLLSGLSLSLDDQRLVGAMIELAGIAIEGRRSEKKILQLAHYDELTGLPNRFLYNQHLAKALLLAERNSRCLAVLFLDLDRFKNINDTFGHDEGDKVLRRVAQRFRHTLRESDIVARVGGDEFILLVDQFNEPRDLGDIAGKLLYEAAQPFEIGGQEYQLSASIGIATFPNDGRDAQTLLKNADIAMYRAKNKGKDNYQFYASEMNIHTIERLAFEARLRKALERREFVVYYQPKISLTTGKIVGAEALVRWSHPEQGILYPNDFIMLAEEAGLIGRMGMLVLDIVCKDILSFRQIDGQFGRIAINLSGSQFNDHQLLEEIRSVIDFWRVPPSAIEFEITESMVMHNREQAMVLMDGFKDAGFSLSIDDFGTGYSSLSYLKRFPVDSVKIDRSFIKDIPADPNDTAIVQAIIVMAHTLGLKVIAEGVDAADQLVSLTNFSCDEYQGFYFSKAVPVKEFLHLLQTQMTNAKSVLAH
ncbi:EAL domain-containing protein [Undibacterium oligocarboniphilum]|uniref:EAL domain-containing protein n=1 Tax=Undibacterium oligocarboniphilum TaxID=666702 RepID=A0A850QPG0_9BURK|nr:EAL domain-containing protein [Undibacterium oligocarboniphilum]MBC3870589.1 EAL domain-containing protein [Undibacterium oligocarboniphilum]NVO78610.1 EAL domain-containing protein [Undibacterium oligocarboniphilum]